LVRFFLPGKPRSARLSFLSGCICAGIRHDRAPFGRFFPEISTLPGKATVSNGHNRFNEKARVEDQLIPTTGCYRICRYSVSLISVPFLNEQNNQIDEAWFGRPNVFNVPGAAIKHLPKS